MFESFFAFWMRFCWDFLGLRDSWFNVAVFIPHHLFLYEVRFKYGSLQSYVDFKDDEKQKERLAKHQERFRDLELL